MGAEYQVVLANNRRVNFGWFLHQITGVTVAATGMYAALRQWSAGSALYPTAIDLLTANATCQLFAWLSRPEKMTNRGQRPDPVADNLGNRQHGHGEDSTGKTPHPEPEDER
jgi:hypothetical protein